jgi:tetratricopeptide (TPR) repeat protein
MKSNPGAPRRISIHTLTQMVRMALTGRMGFRFQHFIGLGVVSAALVATSFAADTPKAEELYKRTDYQGSLAILDKHSNNPAVLNLIGRDYFMLSEFHKAADYFAKALAADPQNSDQALWLGRAFGRCAETANPFSAPGYATKARQNFELAVKLNPKNKEALSDLFDYYLEAPGFLGGGFDKAVGVADQIAATESAEGYFAQARLAQKKKDYSNEESSLRRAVESAPRQVGRVIELAKFLANHGRTLESDAMFSKAEREFPNSPKLWFAHAKILVKQKRNLDEAKVLLQKYLKAPITVDDPPREEAEMLLKQANGA